MLTSLTVKNVVLIDHLVMHFKHGFCGLTGETGAGKSILLDSLGLSLGSRANTKLIRQNTDQATVIADFDLNSNHSVFKVLKQNDIQSDGEVILKRTLKSDGKSKAFINDQPVSVSFLKEVGDILVDIHGQFDNQKIFDQSTHVGYLDLFGGYEDCLKEVEKAWLNWQSIKKERISLQNRKDRLKEEQDYLQTSLHDIDMLSPEKGEEQKLTQLKSKLKNTVNIQEVTQESLQQLDEIQSLSAQIWRGFEKLDDEGQSARDALERMNAEIEEVFNETRLLLDDIDSGGYSLEEIDDRLFALKTQARKHNCNIDDLSNKREEIAQALNEIDNIDDLFAEIVKQENLKKDQYLKISEKLTQQRQKFSKTLSDQIMSEFPALKLDKAKFLIEIDQKDEEDWSVNGVDKVTFLISTNPNSEFGHLKDTASGGELSRISLALKVALSGTGAVPTMVFDEVDSGIGGATAAAVGELLDALSKHKQVLVVTHSPQVAAKADHQWIVQKSEDQDVTVSIEALETKEKRQEEIARMLSAEDVTTEARAAAGKLLEKAA
ncbi:MAG: DNA repair protein RecN [Pseudomonadota bacterium]